MINLTIGPYPYKNRETLKYNVRWCVSLEISSTKQWSLVHTSRLCIRGCWPTYQSSAHTVAIPYKFATLFLSTSTSQCLSKWWLKESSLYTVHTLLFLTIWLFYWRRGGFCSTRDKSHNTRKKRKHECNSFINFFVKNLDYFINNKRNINRIKK